MNLDHKSLFYNDEIYKHIVLHKIIGREEYERREVEYDGRIIPIHTITNEFRIKRNRICMGCLFITYSRTNFISSPLPYGLLPWSRDN